MTHEIMGRIGMSDLISRLPRDMVRKIKAMDGAEMFRFWKNLMEQGYTEGYDAGYAEGLTVDLDEEAIVMDEDEARRRLSDDEFLRLIGGQGE